jgi:hypothetical protein
MTDINNLTSKKADTVPSTAHGKKIKRRAYVQPKILSSDRLEAAAATCAPPAGGFGKHIPTPCGALGS